MIGRTISHYKILSKLGEGGMGVVYKAEDLRLKRTVALKFLPKFLAERKEEKQRFIQEAQAASSLDHVNICNVHEIDETDDGQMFIVMACYVGETLDKKIERGPLKLEEAIGIAAQVADGLAKAHSQDIVHRDIKPSNVMVTDEGVVKILDFGLAKLSGVSKLTKTGTTLGTVQYMSPEQAQGIEVDHSTDIWSVGAIFYEMLTGVAAFGGEHQAAVLYSILNEQPEPLTGLRPEVPIQLTRIVSRSLEKEPEARYSSAEELSQELRTLQSNLAVPVAAPSAFLRLAKRPRVVIPALAALIAFCFAVFYFSQQSANIRWAQQEAIPEIKRLLDEDDLGNAFLLAQQAERYIPDDPKLAELWSEVSRPISVQTEPSGAEVYARAYSDLEAEWRHLGQSPIETTRVPVQAYRWRIEKTGYASVEYADPLNPWGLSREDQLRFELDRESNVPTGMVSIPAATFEERVSGIRLGPLQLDRYFMGRFEVTNEEFKEFTDKGGYEKSAYWKRPFIKEGRKIEWEQAVDLFRDSTGRPGPATWSFGTYPEGQEDFPVAGVSWYEAAAYCEFAGKSLPTIYHWQRAAAPGVANTWIVPLSNFGPKGPAAVGSHQGMSPFGVYDMAGNVKEWCENAIADNRIMMGGAWSDPAYQFGATDAQSPFDRSPTNGFRCVKYEPIPGGSRELTAPLERNVRDFVKEKLASDEIFEVYRRLYSYDPSDLNPVLESTDDTSLYWRKEKIIFDAAYGGERVTAYLFLPKNFSPPFQTVVHFYGVSPFNRSVTSARLVHMGVVGPIIRSGRAVLYPIYKGSYERRVGPRRRSGSAAYRDLVAMWVKDLSRSIDYLETRPDIDSERLALSGNSFGATHAPIFLAIEDRFKTGLLFNGGLLSWNASPEADPLHYLPRVRVPVLMVNGRYDFTFPLNESQAPFFSLLGTPEQDKRHLLSDRGHGGLTLSDDWIREVLDWLDRYLGPVN